jgi:hypothetical protein
MESDRMSNAGRTIGTIYGMLACIGAVVPLAPFLSWLRTYGLDAPRFVAELFANPISSFFGFDVIISAIVLILFVCIQGARDRVKGRGWAILATCCIGVSCGLPLFLALRERALRAR